MFFLSYDFFVIALPLGVLALSAALVGGILLYKKQSLLGDALGHGTYPGVILAYMLFATKSPKILALGIKMLGVLLMASFLVLPMLFARELSGRRNVIFLLAGLLSLFYSLLGTGLSLSQKGFSTGAGIIVLMGGSLMLLLILKELRAGIQSLGHKTLS